uniref:Beta-Casp domain-containing protein n=1 Tax=Rhizophagus irregularis (strain DAOM 181602 / DAOM 197198 / MUCL 43194) TaxID=747089 RepID=U9TDU4_RHIID
MIDCGGEKISIVSSSSTVQNIHPLPFDETVLNNADVIILSDLRDKDGARFETILIEIGNCVGFLSQHLRAVGLRGIPFYAVSPIAEESLKYSNICREWYDVYRETAKMYLPDNLIHHQDMFGQSLLYYASRADSSLQEKYQEPCVVFAGHPSLRSGAAINFIRKWGNNSNNSIIFTESEYDCEEAMSAFEGLQIKSSIYLPIDIRLTVNEVTNMLRERKPPQHDCYDRNLASNIELVNLGKDSLIASLNGTLNIHNTKTSLTSAENQLNQQRYVCGEFDVSKLINELTEQIYGCRIDEFEEDKRNSRFI